MKHLEYILFFQTTFIFLIINIVIAWVPGISIIGIALRDSWILIYFLILLKSRNYLHISFLVVYGILGGFKFIDYGLSQDSLLVYLYGFRDLCLISLVFYFLKYKYSYVGKLYARWFIYLVVGMATFEVLCLALGYPEVSNAIFRTEEYFDAKGVVSNLHGGIFGLRVSAPLYSPALVCTLLSMLLFLNLAKVEKTCIYLLTFLTGSKVLLMTILFVVFRKYSIFIIPSIIVGILLSSVFLPLVIEYFPMTIYSFHAASILDHVNALNFFTVEFISFDPLLLGESSIFAMGRLGKLYEDGPESLLIARMLDLKLLSVGLVAFIAHETLALKGQYRVVAFLFVCIICFSSLSNHPVSYMPFLILVAMPVVLKTEHIK